MGSWRALLKYVKPAFLWRWNLLIFGAGLVFGILSGHPDVVWPLVGAAEIAYLGLLTGNPRFRRAIDARGVKVPSAVDASESLERIEAALKPEAWKRFERLRDRCLALEELGRQFRGPYAQVDAKMADLQTTSLERLLWMFLKLLYSQDALTRFLRTTNRSDLVSLVKEAEKELDAAVSQERSEKLIASLRDKLETLRQRLANYERALEHQEFLNVEIDRIEQKVNAISEAAMNARDPADISAQVDGIAAGISATEEAMRTMDVAPVFEREEPPKLLAR